MIRTAIALFFGTLVWLSGASLPSAEAHPMEGSGLNILDPTVPSSMDIGVMRRGRDAYMVGFKINIYKFLESINALSKHPDLETLTPQSESGSRSWG